MMFCARWTDLQRLMKQSVLHCRVCLCPNGVLNHLEATNPDDIRHVRSLLVHGLTQEQRQDVDKVLGMQNAWVQSAIVLDDQGIQSIPELAREALIGLSKGFVMGPRATEDSRGCLRICCAYGLLRKPQQILPFFIQESHAVGPIFLNPLKYIDPANPIWNDDTETHGLKQIPCLASPL